MSFDINKLSVYTPGIEYAFLKFGQVWVRGVGKMEARELRIVK